MKTLVDKLFNKVPAGVGSTGFVKLTKDQFRKLIVDGGQWAVKNGYGWDEDLARTELNGTALGADASKVSAKAIDRGFSQIGTLGSGNHYLEIQVVKKENIADDKLAKKWGLFEDQIVVMFHCLPEDSRVLTEHGSWIRIKDLENKKIKIKCFDDKSHALIDTEIEKFYKVKNKEKTFKLKTRSGKEIVATEDHPFFTQDGLKFIKDIKIGEKIAVYPFDGIEHEEPTNEIVVDEHAIRSIHNSDKIVNELKSKGLLPLRLDSAYIPIVSKLSGYVTGDGNIRKHGRGWITSILGDVADLKKIKEDIVKLGFKASKIYNTNAGGVVTTHKGIKQEIKGKSNRLECNSSAFTILLTALGVPLGRKTSVEFEVPGWVFKAPKWIKRLYIAGYLGAELTHPIISKSGVHLERLSLAAYKVGNLKENGMKFLSQIKSLLEDFGINSSVFEEINGGRLTNIGRTSKLVLRISSEMTNLINFWSKVDYEYCERKKIESSHALQYLQYKQNILQLNAGKLDTNIHAIKFKPYQYGVNFITISNFLNSHKFNPSTPVIWDAVEILEEIKSKEYFVYDIRVKNQNHNFIANNFVVGNCGSRGFGHQLATDYLQSFLSVMESKYKIKILDRELACAPFNSPEGQNYFGAMKCAVNMSFANRQVILHRIREVFSETFKQDAESLGLRQLFDVAHNRASLEKHKINGEIKEVVVHRKGATGSYPAGREEIPKEFRDDGSPVIIGGSMETGSYLLVGGEKATETFCSTCHGSGRTMSRTQARSMVRGDKLQKDMEARGIYVRSVSFSGLAEESGASYKDIDEVINSVHNAGISKKVCKLLPLGNVKGVSTFMFPMAFSLLLVLFSLALRFSAIGH